MPVTEYTWDPITDSILEETDGAGNVLASYTSEPSPYGPLTSQHSGGETRYFHFDALGSTRELTDDSEDVTDTFTYDAWGNEVQRSGASDTATRWAGRWGYVAISLHSHYYIRRRVLSAAMGSWLSADPLRFADGMNVYRYGYNSPSSVRDPSGLQGKSCRSTPTGVQYVPNRGKFKLFDIGEYVPLKGEAPGLRIGSSMFTIWGWPFDPNPFTDDRGCCCCTKVGFLQIATFTVSRFTLEPFADRIAQRVNYRDLFRNPVTYNWFVDGGIPYPHGPEPKGFPCDPNGSTSISIDDSPNALRLKDLPPVFPHWAILTYLRHDFETCAVCLEGNEGISRSWGRTSGVTVYGCVRWGHEIRLLPDLASYSYHRFMDSPFHYASIGTSRSSSIRFTDFDGVPPSQTFENVVISR